MLFNGFVGDDIGYINHPYIQQAAFDKLFIGGSADLGGESAITGQFYRPLMLVFFSLIYSVFGNTAFFYHFFQLIFHIGNVILLFLLFKKFFSKALSFFLCLIFLVHPMGIETVVYVSDIQDVLFVFFGLSALSILIYTKLHGKLISIFTILLLCSLLSKETGIIFLFLSVLYVLFFRKDAWRKIVSSISIVLGLYLLIRFGIAGVGIGGVVHTQMETLSLSQRLQMVPSLLQYYLQTFVFPKDLAIAQTWIVQPSIYHLLFQIGILAGICGGIGMFLLHLYKKKKAYFWIFSFFLLWFLMGIGMHLQILPLEMTVADRWFYAPLIGLLGMIGCAITSVHHKKYTVFIMGIGIVFILLLSMRSYIRMGDWVNEKTLYEHDRRVTNSYLLEHSLGFQYLQEKNFSKAYTHIRRSIDMFPTSQNMNSLGVYYYNVGDKKQAIIWFEKAIEKGDNFLAYNNLIQLYLKEGSYKNAKKVLQVATKKFPKSDMFWYLLALSSYKMGDTVAALKAAEQAVLLKDIPQYQYVYRKLQLGLPIQFND